GECPAAAQRSRPEEQHERGEERDRFLGDEAPVVAREEGDDRLPSRLCAVDEAARARDELLEPADERVAGKRAPGEREIGGGLAVELAQAQRALRAEPLRPAA